VSMSDLSRPFPKIAAIFIALVALIWSFGFIQFARLVPTNIENVPSHTDAIVVLTGGSERITTGVSLLAQGFGERLFISGVGGPVRAIDLTAPDLRDRESLAAKISLGSKAEDTPGNAQETAQWVARQNIASIRLVTAAYHMPRSMRELKRAMPETLIIPHPVFPKHVKSDWWRYPGTASLIAREYTKYLLSGLRIWLSDIFGQSRDDARRPVTP
jgi:uncharacterized SAM-binding protein YcdF (DUF218 family)